MTILTNKHQQIIKTIHAIRLPTTVNEISIKSGMSRTTIKKYLPVLKSLDIVKSKEEGCRTLWSINYALFNVDYTYDKTSVLRLKNMCTFDENMKINMINNILDFLQDEECLNENGLRLRHEFWEKYIKERT